ncbi:DNA mismatch repair protein MutS [Sphingopyxis lindanitolerans]|uniref:DNA mismatch repair protein MutS n=1 Tax=Sphingopyxis lindanitolerans TaxID=2054227 RepID=A0A2S8B9G2_9SPHN|nr:DNA mismatch repair protein MutS [Sphingopyxis lindanitolerans]PQM28966.1 DNA mismatch repair protein MutS [Sphingopyxis lindanitolerans]
MSVPARPAANSNSAPAATPMMAQYWSLKDKAGDCLLFYRMGDFFELFFDDAKAAAATLDIALTSRGEHGGAPVPMCGVPAHSAESYLARLIKAGHRVAIAEQIETPAEAKARGGSKALVARDIIRFVTAGTLTEEALLEGRSANRLAALARVGSEGEVAIAAADISTGRFEVVAVRPDQVDAELARLAPSELLVSEAAEEVPEWVARQVVRRPPADFSSTTAQKRLEGFFGVQTLDGFGQFGRGELAAMGAIAAYLDHVGTGTPIFLQPPLRHQASGRMAIDAATRESLELVRTMTGVGAGGRDGSLLGTIDRTVTAAGARLLADDLASPLTDREAILDRLDLVDGLARDALWRGDLRRDLRALPDAGRALGRLVAGRGGPRDLAQLRDALGGARLLRERLARRPDLPPLLARLLPGLDGHGALVDELTRALIETPPVDAAQGGYVAEGYDHALDALRETARDGRKAIAALEAGYRDHTGIASLKIRHNGVLGYHVEVPAKHGDALMAPDSGFTHRQTLAGVVRFNSSDLHEAASRVTQAGVHAIAAEAAHLEALTDAAVSRREAIAASCDILARIDVAAALADHAMSHNWCRPDLADEPCLDVAGGRHPVVEAALAKAGERFVPNDVTLSPDDRLWLVTGPNMGGKSTFLRQNALIVVLAQAGGFVPAAAAKLGLVDRLFSRVGASDNLARGRSTFMVEMVETAAILAQATERSFVILDEVGRGTSTYDGLALAWSVVEAVHEVNRCRCLFATHYHELTRLAETLDALSLHHVRAREWQGDLVLLHELAEGPADRSYGLAVARLAGVPAGVVKRAEAVLAKLEAGREKTGGLAAGLDDLPLFAATLAAAPAAAKDALREALAAIDPDALAPREALGELYRLKQILAGEG